MKAIIMAAGKGTRLNEASHPMPKVLREACGRPLLDYVLNTIDFIDNEDITIVVGYMADMVRDAFPDRNFAQQGDDGYGTGYAVKCGIAGGKLEDYEGELAVLSGDVPLIKKSTVEAMLRLQAESGASCTMMSCRSKRELPFGRIIRDEQGRVTGIKEYKDCNEQERKIDEMNVGTYIFDAASLRNALSKLKNNNAQNEYYLTDVPLIMLKNGEHIESYVTEDEDEMLGVNTFADLAIIEDVVKRRESEVK